MPPLLRCVGQVTRHPMTPGRFRFGQVLHFFYYYSGYLNDRRALVGSLHLRSGRSVPILSLLPHSVLCGSGADVFWRPVLQLLSAEKRT